MHESADWQFDIEVHPPDWHFPAGETWVAGWIQLAAGQVITDVRARLHPRIILGLAGLPHPTVEDKAPGQPASIRSGFSFLLNPQPGATLLQLEARNSSGRWIEFFREKISAAPDAATPPTRPRLSQSLGRLVTTLLRRRLRHPEQAWTAESDDLLAAFVAEPLHAHPNSPFRGALEEPTTSAGCATGSFQ